MRCVVPPLGISTGGIAPVSASLNAQARSQPPVHLPCASRAPPLLSLAHRRRPSRPSPPRQDFCASDSTFQTYPAPRVSSLEPVAGPLAGNTTITLFGSYLGGVGERLLCRFRAMLTGDGTDPTVACSATTLLRYHPAPCPPHCRPTIRTRSPLSSPQEPVARPAS